MLGIPSKILCHLFHCRSHLRDMYHALGQLLAPATALLREAAEKERDGRMEMLYAGCGKEDPDR